MEKVVLIGAGGHCKVVIDIIKSCSEFEIVGITDPLKNNEDYFLDVPIIGDDECLEDIYNSGIRYAFISLGSLDNIIYRDKLFYKLRDIGFKLPTLIHKSAIVSPYAKLQEGTCVMPGVIINSGAYIGENCIINSGAIIEHNCIIGRNTHISPGACIAGDTKIGDSCHIGINSTIIQGINIGNNVTIGGGSVVIRDIENNVVAVGIPAKKIKCR